MHHIAVAIEQSTGEPYGGCPWNLFTRPLVVDCVQAYAWWDKKQLGVFTGPNPPARFVEAFDLYQRTVSKLQNDEMDRQREKSKKENPRALVNRARSVRRG